MRNRICPNCKAEFPHFCMICPYCPGMVATIMNYELSDCYTDLFDGNPPPRPNPAIAEFTAGMIVNPHIHKALYSGMEIIPLKEKDISEYLNPYEDIVGKRYDDWDTHPKVSAPPIRQPKTRFRVKIRHVAGILLMHLLIVCLLEAFGVRPIERLRDYFKKEQPELIPPAWTRMHTATNLAEGLLDRRGHLEP